MKKLLLTMMCAMMALVGMAQSKDFEGKLVVTINEISSDPQDATINFVLNEDMTCNFALNNFCLGSGEGDVMPVGNIKLQNLPLVPVNESTFAFSFEGNILIEEGNMEGVDFWIGPSLEEIPLKLVGTVSMDKMEVSIDINMMEKLGQIVQVVFKSNENGSADDIDITNALCFEDDLVVSVNDNSTAPQKAKVYLVPNADGTYSFVLKNFCLGQGEGDVMPIGNILVPGLVPNLTEQGATLDFEGPITIAAGDLEGVDMWMGPMLGEIPLKLSAKSNMTQIYVAIDIVMESMGQTIHVTFGSDYEAGADAITGVQQNRSTRMFDLQGRPVQRMNHGLYIQNGKKILK